MISLNAILKTRRHCTPTTWVLNPNNTFAADGFLRRVKYANGYWVVVGRADQTRPEISKINYTADPTGSWTDPASYTNAPIHYFEDVSHDGTNWATSNLLGYYDYISGSPAGSWTGSYVDAVASRGCLDYGNGYWSMNGMKYATGIVGPWSSSTGNPGPTVVRYGEDGYWVSGANDEIYTAHLTPITFSFGSVPFSPAKPIWGAAYGNGYWVVVGGAGQLAYQTTPPTGSWTLVTNPDGWTPGKSIFNVAYANGTWIIVGYQGNIATQPLVPTGAWTGQTSGVSEDLFGIAYGNGYWVATGQNKTLLYSRVC